MKTIKFRAFDKEQKVFITHKELSDQAWNVYASLANPENSNWVWQQFTGLTDKNGKEIYEGDIVKIKEDWEEYGWKAGEIGFIEYKDFYFGISLNSQNKPGTRYVVYADVNSGSDLEIIGNIYENPERLATLKT